MGRQFNCARIKYAKPQRNMPKSGSANPPNGLNSLYSPLPSECIIALLMVSSFPLCSRRAALILPQCHWQKSSFYRYFWPCHAGLGLVGRVRFQSSKPFENGLPHWLAIAVTFSFLCAFLKPFCYWKKDKANNITLIIRLHLRKWRKIACGEQE